MGAKGIFTGIGLLALCAVLAFVWMQRGGGPARVQIPAQPFEIPPQTPRIVFVGTSLTANYDWPAAVSEHLGACLGLPVEGVVVAGAGRTSRWGGAQLDRVIHAKPDVVVIEFLANDADLRHRLGVTESRANHAGMIGQIHAALPQTRIILMGTNPVYGLRALIRPRTGAYLDSYAALAQSDPRIGLLEMAGFWRAYLDDAAQRDILPDGLHPGVADARQVVVSPLGATLAALWGQECPQADT